MLRSISTLPKASVAPLIATGAAVVGTATAAGVGLGVLNANQVPLTVVNECSQPLTWTPPPVVGAVLSSLNVPPGGRQTLEVPRMTVTLRQEGDRTLVRGMGIQVALDTPNLVSLDFDGVSLGGEGQVVEVRLDDPEGHTLVVTCQR